MDWQQLLRGFSAGCESRSSGEPHTAPPGPRHRLSQIARRWSGHAPVLFVSLLVIVGTITTIPGVGTGAFQVGVSAPAGDGTDSIHLGDDAASAMQTDEDDRVWVLSETRVTAAEDVKPTVGIKGQWAVTELTETSVTIDWQLSNGGQWIWEFEWDRPPAQVRPGETVTFEARGVLTKTNITSGSDASAYIDGPGDDWRNSAIDLSNTDIEGTTGVARGSVKYHITFKEPREVQWYGSEPVYEVSLRLITYSARGKPKLVTWIYRPSESTDGGVVGSTTTVAGSSEQGTSSPSGRVSESGLLTADCAIDQARFDRDWMRYSDFDDRIPVAERSHEAKQYNRLAREISELTVESFELQAEMEVDRQMRLELRAYRAKLVQNQKENLLRAFWRLSYVTYTTIKTGRDLGRTYEKAFTSVDALPRIGHGLKVVKGLTPPSSQSPSTTVEQVEQHVKELGVGAALDLLTSDSPAEFGVSMFNSVQTEAGKAVVPSADISPEEIAILREQHLEKQVIDEVLQESYRKNSDRRKRVEAIHISIITKGEELEQWEQAEKERVARELQAACEADGGQ